MDFYKSIKNLALIVGANIAFNQLFPDLAKKKDEIWDTVTMKPKDNNHGAVEPIYYSAQGHIHPEYYVANPQFDKLLATVDKPAPSVEDKPAPTRPILGQEQNERLRKSGINMNTYNSKETLDAPSSRSAYNDIQPKKEVGLDPLTAKLDRLNQKLQKANINMNTYNSKETLDSPSSRSAYNDIQPRILAKAGAEAGQNIQETIQRTIQVQKAEEAKKAEQAATQEPQTLVEKADEAYSNPALAYYSLMRRSRR